MCSEVLDILKTLTNINAIHHPGDTTDLEFSDVSDALDCVQLALSIWYWALYAWMGRGIRDAGLCICVISAGRERLMALINTCRHFTRLSFIRCCQSNVGFWDRYPYSVNHRPSLNSSPMCKCMRHLINALWWQGGPRKVKECVQCGRLWNKNLFATCPHVQDERINSCN